MTRSCDGVDDPIRILYVNDDDAFADLVATKLDAIAPDIEVTVAGSASEALSMLPDAGVECVVTAYALSDRTGVDFIRAIRDRDADLPTVLFTGRGSEQIASEATRADASDYVPIEAGQESFELLASRVRTLVDARRQRQRARQSTDRFRRTLERTTDAIYAVDGDWRIEYMNEKMADRVDRDRQAVVGNVLWEEFPSVVGTDVEERYRQVVETGEPATFEQYLGDPFDYWVEVRLFPDEDGLTVFSQEVSDDRERQQDLERTETILSHVHDVVFLVDEDVRVQYANPAAARILGYEDASALTGELLADAVADTVSDALRDEFRATIEEALADDPADPGEDGLYDADVQFEYETATGTRWFDVRLTPFDQADDRQVLVVGRDVTEQKRLETRLRALQETGRQLSVASSTAEIGRVAVEAAVDVLDLDVTGVWEYDESENALVPIAESEPAGDLFGGAPTFETGEGLAWDAFDAGEVRVYDDVRNRESRYNPDTEMRSEMYVPLGEYGILVSGSRSVREFSETDVDLFRILGRATEAAMERAAREETLRRQNERLDEFASVVAHDLRNPLTVAMGFLEVARENGDPDHFDRIASAHDRMERLIDDLLTLSRGETTVADADRLDLGDVAREAWGYVGTSEATLSVEPDVPTVAGDADRLTQLFENLFRNAVEHGSTGNQSETDDTVEHGSTSSRPKAEDTVEHGGADVSVTVGPLADGFYVADDGPGIPPDRREEVFEHGVTYSHSGTGFGLSIVADIARSHGWAVSLTESEAGGARFEFRPE